MKIKKIKPSPCNAVMALSHVMLAQPFLFTFKVWKSSWFLSQIRGVPTDPCLLDSYRLKPARCALVGLHACQGALRSSKERTGAPLVFAKTTVPEKEHFNYNFVAYLRHICCKTNIYSYYCYYFNNTYLFVSASSYWIGWSKFCFGYSYYRAWLRGLSQYDQSWLWASRL